MCAQFGQKWAKLHHGPMWTTIAGDQKLNTMKVNSSCECKTVHIIHY